MVIESYTGLLETVALFLYSVEMTYGILIMFTIFWIGIAGLLSLLFKIKNNEEGGIVFCYILSAIIVFISAPYLPESLYEFFSFG